MKTRFSEFASLLCVNSSNSANDKKLVSLLSNKNLQAIIKKIDSSHSRFEELEHYIEADSDFEAFIVTLMQSLGYFDSQGRFIDPSE